MRGSRGRSARGGRYGGRRCNRTPRTSFVWNTYSIQATSQSWDGRSPLGGRWREARPAVTSPDCQRLRCHPPYVPFRGADSRDPPPEVGPNQMSTLNCWRCTAPVRRHPDRETARPRRGNHEANLAAQSAAQLHHRRPRRGSPTTMRYDRARHSLDRHATYIVSTFVAGASR